MVSMFYCMDLQYLYFTAHIYLFSVQLVHRFSVFIWSMWGFVCVCVCVCVFWGGGGGGVIYDFQEFYSMMIKCQQSIFFKNNPTMFYLL